jgi:tripartite-type tricarboxylate transporter receptor subunit TctC
MKMPSFTAALIAVLAALAISLDARTQDYPAKPVRVVVPFTPGTATDVLARLVCSRLGGVWHQQVVVDNRSGAGGTLGVAAVAKSPPDGYTLLWHSNAFATSAAVYGNLPYEPLRDLAEISPLVSTPLTLVLSPALGVTSVAELVAAAKAKPGQLTYGSNGVGSGTHFAAEKFRIATGVDVVHVPYKGGPEVNGDVIAGRVTYWFSPILMAAPNVREGKLVALGVTSAQRSADLPGVPAIAETGLPGFDYKIWWGLWAPARTRGELIDKIAYDMAGVLSEREMRERLARLGAEPMPVMSPAVFARFVRSEIDDATRIVKSSGVKPE